MKSKEREKETIRLSATGRWVWSSERLMSVVRCTSSKIGRNGPNRNCPGPTSALTCTDSKWRARSNEGMACEWKNYLLLRPVVRSFSLKRPASMKESVCTTTTYLLLFYVTSLDKILLYEMELTHTHTVLLEHIRQKKEAYIRMYVCKRAER